MFYEERNGKLYVVAPMEMKLIEHNEGEVARPSLHISHFMAPVFLESLATALDNHGVKTENDHKIKGTLDATKYHLEDLRTLLKLTGARK